MLNTGETVWVRVITSDGTRGRIPVGISSCLLGEEVSLIVPMTLLRMSQNYLSPYPDVLGVSNHI